MKKNQKFDVTISTLQSELKLRECLDSVLREIPVNRIIVIDGGSTDGTLEILRQCPQVELYVRPNLNLGQSHEFAFSKVTTEWFIQLDSDVVLQKGWFSEMTKDMDKADIIEGGVIEHIPPIPSPNLDQAGRAYFFNNLIRTEAIKGVKLNCHHSEDELTRRYAESYGYKWYKNGCLLSDHYSNPVRYQDEKYKLIVTRQSFPDWVYIDQGRLDAISGLAFLGATMSITLQFLFSILRNFRSLISDWKKLSLYFKGYLAGRKEEIIVNPNSRMGIRQKYRLIFNSRMGIRQKYRLIFFSRRGKRQ